MKEPRLKGLEGWGEGPKILRLAAEEAAEEVDAPRFVHIRYYGLFANRHRNHELERSRALLGAAPPPELAEREDWQAVFVRVTGQDPGKTGDISPMAANGLVVAPIVINKFPPEYPARASALKLEQIVEIEVIVDAAGATSQPRLVTINADPALAFAAFEAVKQWVFRPGMFEGKPVVTLYNLKVKFKQPPA